MFIVSTGPKGNMSAWRFRLHERMGSYWRCSNVRSSALIIRYRQSTCTGFPMKCLGVQTERFENDTAHERSIYLRRGALNL